MNGSTYYIKGIDANAIYHGQYNKAAVATDNINCSKIARDVLQRGGSAVDAAITAMLCVGIQNCHSTGIGGGVVMTVYDAKTGDSVFFNSLSKSASNAHYGVYGTAEQTYHRVLQGATAVALPGCISSFWSAHQRYGRLEWKELFHPAIRMASEGIGIERALAEAIQKQKKAIESSPSLREYFLRPNGTLKREGDTLKMPKLAETLRKISKKGNATFYGGEVTEMILDDLRRHPGENSVLTATDFENYETESSALLEFDLDGLTFLVPTSPSGGPIACSILKILKGFNMGPDCIKDHHSKLRTYHRITEAFKAAYLQRVGLGDPKHNEKIFEFVERLISDEFNEEQRKRINDEKAGSSLQFGVDLAPYFPPDDEGTSHISLLDEFGNAVSMTSTINYYFGSKVVGSRTGIIFNNGMKNFSIPSKEMNQRDVPEKATFPIAVPSNLIGPNKRALSSMCPIIVLDKALPTSSRVQLVIGASGGVRIPTAVSWVLINHLWFKMSVEKAVITPRIHARVGKKLELQIEEDADEKIVEGLQESKKHVLSSRPYGKPGTVVQVVSKIRCHGIAAASDPRKHGIADGY